jgi:hypothetical protein
MDTFLRQPIKLFFALVPGRLYGSTLPPMNTLLDDSMLNDPVAIHFSV